MLHLQRLNMDSSWYLQWEDTACLIDPWLVGSEVDGFRWLNEQWHVTDPVPLDQLPAYDFILITQSYSDHCHPETLALLPPDKPIYATEKACQRLRKVLHGRSLYQIPELAAKKGLMAGKLSLQAIRPNRKRDPIYYGLLITNQAGESIVYTPHGFSFTPAQEKALQAYSCKLLMTTFTEFSLPAIMGGKVNPGLQNAKYLAHVLQARHVLNTHDEPKKAKGLVARLAKINYPDLASLAQLEGLNFVAAPDYRALSF